MNSRFVPGTDTFGHPAIGPTAMTLMTTTGCRARGCWRRKSGSCGLQVIGAGAARVLFSTRVTGARWLVSTAGGTIVCGFFVEACHEGQGGTHTFSFRTPGRTETKTLSRTRTTTP